MARSTSSSVAVPETSPREVSGRPAPNGASVARQLLRSLRPGQWTKNLLVFAGLLFGRRLLDPPAIGEALAAFVIFCALSGAVYLLNDVADREADRRHPLKKLRPIASGALPVPAALGAAALLAAAALGASFRMSASLGAISAGYLLLQAAYSNGLKNIVILDVLAIALGFVLRAVAGAVAVHVEISHWLFVCTILLALFIALAKRRHELVLLAGDAALHRPILGEYTAYLLDQMIAIVAACTLIAYIFYTISPETSEKFGSQWLGLTIPFPLYGILRYLYLVHQREGGGSPADLLLTDRPLLACVALWAVAVAILIYRP
jgi:4-hydroxybenzoate polyprenyltransferase